MGYFDRLVNIDGTALQEAILTDPEVAEAMSRQKRSQTRPKPRIFGYTKEVSLLTSLLEAQLRTRLPRPELPSDRIAMERSAKKLKSKLSKQFGLSD